MRHILIMISILALFSCGGQKKMNTNGNTSSVPGVRQQSLNNEDIRKHKFLEEMYSDDYYPRHLVDKVQEILLELCMHIERTQPKDLDELYRLSKAATAKINALDEEFIRSQSEIETLARDVIATDFEFIARSYGYTADVEELISNREW